MTYQEKLKDPRWQKKRLEILERDEWKCIKCGDDKNTLHVHHKLYRNDTDPWEYEDDVYITLCEKCHETEHQSDKLPEKLVFFIKRQDLTAKLMFIDVIANKFYDGHFTIFGFTSHYKIIFGTPNFDTEGREDISCLTEYKDIDEALTNEILIALELNLTEK